MIGKLADGQVLDTIFKNYAKASLWPVEVVGWCPQQVILPHSMEWTKSIDEFEVSGVDDGSPAGEQRGPGLSMNPFGCWG